MLTLNKTSYCHLKIRSLCYSLEKISGMKLETDLSKKFDQIKFINRVGYIIIDYKKNACFSLSHRITNSEIEIIDEIMISCNWLEIGNIVQGRRKGKK